MKRVLTFKRAVFIGLFAGCVSAFVMTLFWNVFGRLILNFADFSYVRELLLGSPDFSIKAILTYNLQNFTGAFILSMLYFMAIKYINSNQIIGVIFFILFACFGFVFFVSWSVIIADDLNALLVIFLMDDVFQSLFITMPIALMAPRGREGFFDS